MRQARTGYDHLAGTVAVRLHDRLLALGWLAANQRRGQEDYELTPAGRQGFAELGIDTDTLRLHRRRFAYGCLDWSERRPHLGGALGAALLEAAVRRKWFARDLDSRILSVTARGRAEQAARFGVRW